MVTFLPSYMMDVESSRTYVDQLFSTEQEKCLEAVVQLKNSVIGSNKQKTQVLQMGVIPRLMAFLLDEGSTTELLVATTVVLGSLAKGNQEHVRSLMDSGIVPLLLKGLCHGSMPYVEACLRCLRTIFVNPAAYGDILYQDSQVMCQLMSLVSYSTCTQECISNIVAFTCKTVDHQIVLYNSGAIPALIPLLSCNIYKVLMPTLKCLAAICHHNEEVSAAIAAASYNGENVIDTIAKQLTRDKTPQMQIACAKCLTYISRTGALGADDPRIIFKTLPALVRMCKKDQAIEDRVDAAESLAYLTEVDSQLQRIASFSDHLITTLSEFLKYEHSPEPSTIIRGNQIYVHKLDDGLVVSEMKQAAFLAFASLGANDEDIRKKIRKVRDKKTSDLIIESSDDKIIETDSLMDQVVSSLSDPSIKVRLAAVRCLHSLSRSVQQLRTGFQDHAVWKPLMKLLQNAPDEVLRVASSTLCNLLLEFSPSKEPILESGAIDLLCKLTRREDPALRLNGIWALMNMAFQAEQKIKSNILNTLGTDQIFHLLSDPDVNILMKTLGLLRNLLSTKPHIEHIMGLHGKQIMQAVILILEGDHSIEVKEQAICILANIADGDYAKDFIMSNEDVLKKLMNYMMHPNVKLQVAATFCISNLVWTEEEGAIERQAKLRELGVQKILQTLLNTEDTTLFDKVKTALQQFT